MKSWMRNNYTNFGNDFSHVKLQDPVLFKENFIKYNSFSFSKAKQLVSFDEIMLTTALRALVRATRRANYSKREKERERES